MNGNGLGHATGKEPVERVIELFVHTPIGLAVMAWKRVPELVVSVPDIVGQVVAKGCAQWSETEGRLSEEVRKARMIGQVAVTFGGRQLRREVDSRLRDAKQAAGGVAGFLPGLGGDGPTPTSKVPAAAGGSNGAGAGAPAGPGPVSGPVTAAAAAPATTTGASAATAAPATKSGPTAAKAAPAKTTGARKAPKAAPAKTTGAGKVAKAAPAKPAPAKPAKATRSPASPPAAPSAAALPIREYDGLSASQVVSRLTGLTPDEMRAVRAYEDASRARRTVLVAIDRLLG